MKLVFGDVLGGLGQGGEAALDLDRLIETRALVEANSGGGKSYALRKLIEKMSGHVQIIVIDIEGEFATLREKFPFLLVGKEGDIPISPRTADVLARKLLQLQVSAILDLYELEQQDRKRFVRIFLDAMIDAPKELWHPCIVIVDEAHQFAPEKGESEALNSVNDLMTRGRKRGFCLPPGELVITSEGLRPIEMITPGTEVLTSKGRFRKVLAVSQRQYDGDVVHVRSFGSLKGTTTTPDHNFMVHLTHNNGGGTRIVEQAAWVPARSLVAGESKYPTRVFTPSFSERVDRLEASVSYEPRNRLPQTRKGIKRHCRKSFSLPVSDAFMRVSGWYLAEGSLIRRKYQNSTYLGGVVFSLGVDEREEARLLQEDLASLGLRSHNVVVGSSLRVVAKRRGFGELMRSIYSEYSHSKCIPVWVLRLPDAKIECLLAAYLSGDGWQHTQDRWIASTVSLQMASSIRLIGQKVGYHVGITRAPISDTIRGRKVNCHEKYRLSFSRISRTGKRFDDGSVCTSIIDKSSCRYSGQVYDLQVDEDESFCTVDHVIHNCGILATQRLSKLHKDAAAEANNKLIGRTGLDLDMKRASEELGFTSKEQMLSLRDLDAGEFYMFGPAFSKTVEKVKVREVVTSHPKLGNRLGATTTAAPEEIKAMLAELSDIPQVAEKELKDRQDLLNRIRELQTELRTVKATTWNIDPAQLKQAEERGRATAGREYMVQIKSLTLALEKQKTTLGHIALTASKAAGIEVPKVEVAPLKSTAGMEWEARQKKEIAKRVEPQQEAPSSDPPPSEEEEEGPLKAGARRMLSVVASFHPIPVTRDQVGLLGDVSPSSGTFTDYLSALKRRGYITVNGVEVKATAEGVRAAGNVAQVPMETSQLVEMWGRKLKAGARRMLQVVVDSYPTPITRAELREKAGMANSGTFTDYFSLLRRNHLIEVNGDEVLASSALFPN